jgi:hypothetical protein
MLLLSVLASSATRKHMSELGCVTTQEEKTVRTSVVRWHYTLIDTLYEAVFRNAGA